MRTRNWETHFAPSFIVALLLVWAASACSDSSGPSESSSTPTTLTALEGMGLQAPAGTVLPDGPTVEVLDQRGDPMGGVAVSFQVAEGGGTVPDPVRLTNAQGVARTPWILGRGAGSPQRLIASVGTLSVAFQATTIEPVPGASYFGRNSYTEYLAGNLPVILSAPHGGSERPAEIPDRTWGTTVQDRNTLDLALRIREAVHEKVGAYPHVILSRIHRIKLDPNREIEEAAQGDPESERAWWEFQTFIDEASLSVQEDFGDGLYIDLHGHGHEIQRLELGYMLSSSDLASTDEVLSGPTFVNKSSFKELGQRPGVTFADLIRGTNSLGSLFEALGVPAVPSLAQPNPGGHPFFSGGYNTGRHGSRNGGQVSGVQIECNYTGIRDTSVNRVAFAQNLAEVLVTFFPAVFGRELAGSGPSLGLVPNP